MNMKITKEDHLRLMGGLKEKLIFGSRLFGTHTDESDYDYVMIYNFEKVFGVDENNFERFPNIHSFQFDDYPNKSQYVWMTDKQFDIILTSGDGTILSDILMFGECNISNKDKLFFCRTYKIIKAYCGVAKRDLKLHPKNIKKRFHVLRSLYIANALMDGYIPNVKEIQKISEDVESVKIIDMVKWVNDSRERANKMLNNKELVQYNIKPSGDVLLDKLLDSNNIGEFKY